jgi:hypothetical protein
MNAATPAGTKLKAGKPPGNHPLPFFIRYHALFYLKTSFSSELQKKPVIYQFLVAVDLFFI